MERLWLLRFAHTWDLTSALLPRDPTGTGGRRFQGPPEAARGRQVMISYQMGLEPMGTVNSLQ